MTCTYTQAYLLGIREGRSTLKRMHLDGNSSLDCILDHIANLKAMTGFKGDMAEHIRGELDFWRNQVSKVSA